MLLKNLFYLGRVSVYLHAALFPPHTYTENTHSHYTYILFAYMSLNCTQNYAVHCASIAWDLLRIDFYGFTAFCKWFFAAYPTYFVSPLRISGSAVESLFSQYKHIAGGKLDAVNYTTARGAHLMKQIVSEHHSGTDYRDQSISVAELGLKKKTYNSTKK